MDARTLFTEQIGSNSAGHGCAQLLTDLQSKFLAKRIPACRGRQERKRQGLPCTRFSEGSPMPAAVIVRVQQNGNGTATLYLGLPGLLHHIPWRTPKFILVNPPAKGLDAAEGCLIEIGEKCLYIRNRQWAWRIKGTDQISLVAKVKRASEYAHH